uniref:F-box domain-containing protein n=1 Tax=Culex tarsalis TaxID=7177 RepID=A0A1Q3F436_CULTA
MEDINALPTEVLAHILTYLEVEELKAASQVCHLWYHILQGARFNRRMVMRINSTFADPPTEQEKCALIRCRNLQITQWDELFVCYDEYDEDDEEDEDENGEENIRKIPVVEFKYLFQPSPEQNAADLLFSQELNLESLELCSTFAGCRHILEDHVQQLRNLTELSLEIEFGRKSNPISMDHSFWALRHDRIRKLKLSFEHRKNNFSVVTPALTNLEVRPFTIFSMPIITPYASQLQRVDLQLDKPELVNDLLALKFPALTQLRVRIDDDREQQERYARLQHRHADICVDEQFIKSMPKLRRFRCESNLLFYRMGSALMRIGHRQLEEIKLDSMHFDARLLRVLQALPKLKTFKMHRCEALPPPHTPHVLPRLNLPQLDELSLVYNESDIAFDKGLAGLKTLKMTVWSSKNHKFLNKICNNLPNLEVLRLILNTKLVNTAFRFLNRLTKLRSLSVDNVELTERLWQYCPEMTGVRKLVLTNGNLTMGTVTAIARLFPALNELHLDECYFHNCDKESKSESESEEDSESESDEEKEDKIIQAQYEDRVRQYFPKCKVSLYRTMFMKRKY